MEERVEREEEGGGGGRRDWEGGRVKERLGRGEGEGETGKGGG